ncbi:hypothetical protein KY317_00790 [Candidatus Woesearchaeota archaeon]|nr:hypothetical protein [Candidatus Woesearchaeota archaeon]
MKEKTLLKTALICSIAGIIFLFFISEIIEIPEKQINEITEKDENVRIKGIVNRITEKEKVAYIEIIQPEEISVVIFKEKGNIELKEGEYVEVTGKTEEYKKEIQIIGNVVKKI